LPVQLAFGFGLGPVGWVQLGSLPGSGLLSVWPSSSSVHQLTIFNCPSSVWVRQSLSVTTAVRPSTNSSPGLGLAQLPSGPGLAWVWVNWVLRHWVCHCLGQLGWVINNCLAWVIGWFTGSAGFHWVNVAFIGSGSGPLSSVIGSLFFTPLTVFVLQ